MQENPESGVSIVSVVIGMALTILVVMAAQQFFFKSTQSAKVLSGESEFTGHLQMMLRQSLNGGTKDGSKAPKCLELEDLKVSFRKNIGAPTVLMSRKEKTNIENRNRKDASLAILRNSDTKDYDIVRFRVIQKSSVFGRDPGRVVADLELAVVDRVRKLQTIVTVPMVLDLNDSMQAVDCNHTPTPEEICEKMNGNFDDKAAGNPSACLL